MPATQYVTIVAAGGTPIRIADQTGAPIPTTGAGELVFATNPTLENPTINGATWTGPQTIAGDLTVEDDLIVEGDLEIQGDFDISGAFTLDGDLVVNGDATVRDTLILQGATSGQTVLIASAIASGTLTFPAATDTVLGRTTAATLQNKSIDGLQNTLTNLPATGLTGIVPLANGGTGVVGFGEVTSKTANYTVLAADSLKDFDNNAAVGSVTFALPASTVGLAYGFAVMEAQNLVIDAPPGVTIYFGEGLLTTAGGTLTANTVGSYIFIKCRSATEWLAQSVIGSWTPT